MSRQSIGIRFGQHLALTPALQQSIKLLQLSSLDLEAEVARALDENPMLEGEVTDLSSPEASAQPTVQTIAAQDVPRPQAEQMARVGQHHRDDEAGERPESAATESLGEYLLGQLGTTRASARDAALVGLLIEDLNDDGFLESSLVEIQTMLGPELDVELDELQAALSLLQSFDPAGVGARDLAQSLCLQLQRPDFECLPALRDPIVLKAAQVICEAHLDVLASGNMNRLKELLGCSTETLQQAHTSILHLNPRPASQWTRPAADFAVPDVLVRKKNGVWQASLNDAVVPKLKVNTVYAQALGNPRGSEYGALHDQVQQARWLIRNLAQRFETILRVSQAIVTHQQLFFEEGWGALRPLTLRDIAGELGLHESTVSRATTQKFMLTPFGTLELKRFFGAGLATEGGEATSSTAVQTRIKALIDGEDRLKPLSDGQLAKLLDEEGVSIARRTVAKYRELMRIPTASLRKSHAHGQRIAS